jgi:hypothetical protein
MTAMLHDIPWEVPASLAGAALLLHTARRVFRAIRDRQPAGSRHGLRTAIIALGAALAPVFFTDMFMTVVNLLGPSFHGWAWTVPAATEGSFIFLYLLDLYLLAEGKPMGWLRFAPYPFALASLVLNVYSSFGDAPGMLGHGVVTVAFFLPLLAGEAAVKSMSVSDKEVALADEMKAARQYAIDLVRDQLGFFWRLRPSVPTLLRTRIVSGRLPGHVARAVRDGVAACDATVWEAAVEKMVTDALTQRAKMAAAVVRQERDIQQTADATTDTTTDATTGATRDATPERQAARQPKRQLTASERDKNRAKAARIVAAEPAIRAEDLAARCGVTKRSAERWKAEMSRPNLQLAESS